MQSKKTTMEIKALLAKAKNTISIIGVAGIGKQVISFLDELNSQSKLDVKILTENENYLFSKTRLVDNNQTEERVSFSSLLFENKAVNNYPKNKNIDIQVCYIDLPFRLISIDNDIYLNNWITIPTSEYELVNSGNSNFNEIIEFKKLIFNPEIGEKFSAPFLNKKGKETETIELFDEKRIRRGIFPRSAFYDSDFIKLVVWVFIFDRSGRLLVHKRAENAKDNQGMWDKSVGGHADYKNDIDTSKTVPREVIEELVTNETSGSGLIQTNDENVIFMGEWRPDKRKHFPFIELEKQKDSWAYFRLPEFERTSSPRILPNGDIRNNEVIADVYMFLLSKDVNKDNVNSLENSSYKLLFPNEIKNAIQNSTQNQPDKSFDSEKELKFTPDLKYSFSSKLRDEIENFSEFVKMYING